MRLPVLDDHIHLQPSGRGLDAIRDFSKAGGTHAILSHLPYEEVRISKESDFADSYAITLKMAEMANKDTDVRVYSVIGPYPVLLLDLAKKHGLQRAKEIMFGGMDIAHGMIKEGRAVGFGEIGRPHFQIESDLLVASNEIMEYGMRLAAESDCPVVLHTESSTPEVMADLAKRADKAGLDRGRVVKHYCSPLVTKDENFGLFPSILASRPAVREALGKGTRFFMETDYLDDRSRPGAVMDITTVPKRTKAMLSSGEMTEEQAVTIHQENALRVYGIEIE